MLLFSSRGQQVDVVAHSFLGAVFEKFLSFLGHTTDELE